MKPRNYLALEALALDAPPSDDRIMLRVTAFLCGALFLLALIPR